MIEEQKQAQTKAEQAEAILSRYRVPLLRTALALQRRLYNIVREGFLVYLHSGDAELEYYARIYPIYELAEYLCWVEIARRDMQFLDLGSEKLNTDFVHHLDTTQHAISTEKFPRPLRLFHGEQRAIGELLMMRTDNPSSARHESLGYVGFCTRLDRDAEFAKWFERLYNDMDRIASAKHEEQSRLIVLQNRLIDLIEFLDEKELQRSELYKGRLE